MKQFTLPAIVVSCVVGVIIAGAFEQGERNARTKAAAEKAKAAVAAVQHIEGCPTSLKGKPLIFTQYKESDLTEAMLLCVYSAAPIEKKLVRVKK